MQWSQDVCKVAWNMSVQYLGDIVSPNSFKKQTNKQKQNKQQQQQQTRERDKKEREKNIHLTSLNQLLIYLYTLTHSPTTRARTHACEQ